MSFGIDVNILLYASDESSPLRDKAVEFLHQCVGGREVPMTRAPISDDPNSDDVTMDEDDSLSWPDPEKVSAWWQANGHRFAPGTRYFMGEPPSPAHCLSVLKTGFQGQRIAAAEYLSLMKPGTPLFNTAAPARRQQRWQSWRASPRSADYLGRHVCHAASAASKSARRASRIVDIPCSVVAVPPPPVRETS